MKNRPHIYAGWSLGLLAVGAAAFAFPAIAEQAEVQREAALWADKASAFTQMQAEGVEETPNLILDMAEVSTASSTMTAHQRDKDLIEPFMPLDPTLRLKAKAEMAEHLCLSEAVYYEARSETRSGQIGVAEVIKNRVKSKHYPNTICGVVYQGSERRTGCQFSFTCDGSMEKAPKGKAWERSKEIAALSLTGLAPELTRKATHYHTTDVNPVWASTLRYNGQIGSHKFYRFKWKERPITSSVSMNVAPPT